MDANNPLWSPERICDQLVDLASILRAKHDSQVSTEAYQRYRQIGSDTEDISGQPHGCNLGDGLSHVNPA